MSKSKKLATAALAGLFAAGALSAPLAFANDHASHDKPAAEKSKCKTDDGKDKHACKGMNSCKGNGGDGKNACKGKGSCATDGSKK